MELRCMVTDSGGRRHLLDKVEQVELLRSWDSPADALTLVAFGQLAPNRAGKVALWDGNRLLFEGRVDRQEDVRGAEGQVVRLECRSAGAVLLDDEAPPKLFSSIGGKEIFEGYIRPYGFALGEELPSAVLPSYKITAGLRVWEVFALFCLRAYGKMPYLAGDGRFYLGRSGSVCTLDEAQLTKICHVYYPYKILSDVYVRDKQGYYTTRVKNDYLEDSGLIRRRFVVPSPQWDTERWGDAHHRILASMREAFLLQVTLRELAKIGVGEHLIFPKTIDPGGCTFATEVLHRVDKQGTQTQITCGGGGLATEAGAPAGL